VEPCRKGHRYSVSIQLDGLRTPALPDTGSNVGSRSRSFFGFTPLEGVTPPVFLPTVFTEGAYHFNTSVVQGQTGFIDPLVPSATISRSARTIQISRRCHCRTSAMVSSTFFQCDGSSLATVKAKYMNGIFAPE